MSVLHSFNVNYVHQPLLAALMCVIFTSLYVDMIDNGWSAGARWATSSWSWSTDDGLRSAGHDSATACPSAPTWCWVEPVQM